MAPRAVFDRDVPLSVGLLGCGDSSDVLLETPSSFDASRALRGICTFAAVPTVEAGPFRDV